MIFLESFTQELEKAALTRSADTTITRSLGKKKKKSYSSVFPGPFNYKGTQPETIANVETNK